MGSSRSRLTAEQVAADVDLTNKTVFITGASSGLGLETARVLACRGARVVMAARDKNKLIAAIDTIKADQPNSQLVPFSLDMSSLASVRQAAEEYKATGFPLHILILNAGVMAVPYGLSVDGIETHMATNHVAHHYLTQLLMPVLTQTAATTPVRVIAVSSYAYSMHAYIDYRHLPDPKPSHYSAWRWYGQSKWANILFANELNRRYAAQGITAYSLHPGVIATSLYRSAGMGGVAFKTITYPWSKSVQQGASTAVYAATSADVRGKGEGQYLENNAVVPSVMKGAKPGEAERLWAWTEELIKSKQAERM